MDKVDSIVIGAGVVGLAVAKAMSEKGEVYVLEQHEEIAQETSSRNSGVIHAGLYYPKDWLKTKLCIKGRQKLYHYLNAKSIAYQKVGKLIVATEQQRSALHSLKKMAESSGVEGLSFLDKASLKALEPDVLADCALFSAETGIVDTQALMLALQADIERQGSAVLCQQRVSHVSYQAVDEQFIVSVNTATQDPYQVACRQLVIATGLYSLGGLQQLLPEHQPRYWAKGHYFRYQEKSPFSHLIYPMPETQGLGIHATLGVDGQLRFGPDVQYMPVKDTVNYNFDESRKAGFIDAIKRYYPGLKPDKLLPDYAGIRPKLANADSEVRDFSVLTYRQHGIKALVCLEGIESPGLTASLALADFVLEALEQ